MANFYLDEDFPIAVAGLLTAAGHPTRTTVAAGRVGRWDAEQLLYATEQGWTIVTHNRRDFRALHEGWIVWSSRWREPRPHGGILTLLAVDGLTLVNGTFEWFARNGGEWVEWRPVNQLSG